MRARQARGDGWRGEWSMASARMIIGASELAAFCGRHGIVRLSLFGSTLERRSNPASDVDLLVEFELGRTPGLFRIAEMEAELSRLIGLRVDLRTARDLSRYFRDHVVRSAEVQYAR